MMATKNLPIFSLHLLEINSSTKLEPQFLPLRVLPSQLSYNQMDQVSRGSRGSILNTGRVWMHCWKTLFRIIFFEKKFLMALIIIFLSIWQLPNWKERTPWMCEWLKDFRNSSMWGCLFGAGNRSCSHFKGWKRMLQSRQRQMQTGWQKWRWCILNLHEYLK